MRYDDFSVDDQWLIDAFLDKYNKAMEDRPFGYIDVYPEELQDDEVFFRTKDEMLEVIDDMDARYETGPYRDMVDGLREYFDGAEYDLGDLEPYGLGWGTIARVGDGRYLVMSNSWSDSGMFRNR